MDWNEAERSASAAERPVVHHLGVLATLAALHQSDPLATTEPRPVSRWGRFESLVPIGSGALGTVYQCWDPLLERAVALKLLHASSSDDRALTEARYLAKVRHVNVVTVHGVDRVEGRVGLWMEFLSGRSLKEEVALHGPFSTREAASIGADLCRGLAAVHNAGLVHGDVKAQNVVREPDGRVVLTDFGAGVHHDTTAGGTPPLAGTPFYMAPELFEGRSVSVRSDVYSVGVLLFYLVTGEFPVRADSYLELVRAHQARQRRAVRDVRPDVSAAFAQVVDRALAPEPDDRFGSVRELEAAVRDAMPPDDTRRQSPWRVITVAIGFVAALGVVAWLWVRPIAPSGVETVRSIAVLPFTNLSGNADEEYVADGMTEMLTSDLAQLNALKVTSRTSAMRFKKTQQGSTEIGKALHVDALVEGSIARVDGNVRVTAQVIRANTDEHLWSETFERRENDLFGLQAEMAAAIATAIKVAVGVTSSQRLSRTRPVNPEAQDAYLRARSLIEQSGANNERLALDYLQKAVALDASYARAFALLARCYTRLDLLGEITHAEASRLAYEAVTRAIALDEELAEGHGQLADILLYDKWDWSGAEREYRRAIQLNGSNTLALSRYSRLLSAVGHHHDALENARLAADADPLSIEALDSRPLALSLRRSVQRGR